MALPINDIFSLILGNFLSMVLRLFICLTKSETLVVDTLSALMDSPRYLVNSVVLLLISGGMLRYILFRI